MSFPNRVVIGALDGALNRVDAALHKEGDKVRCNADIMRQLREERAALVEARKFVVDNRRDTSARVERQHLPGCPWLTQGFGICVCDTDRREP